MKISFKNLETEEILNEWELLPSQEKFWKSPKRVVLFSGGFGCIDSKTKILNADTNEEERIEDLWKKQKRIRVYSLTPFGIKKAYALPPIRYSKTKLYQVNTFLATKNHRIFSSGKWVKISKMEKNFSLTSFSQLKTNKVSFLSVLYVNVFHYCQIILNYLFGYSSCCYQYDEPLQFLKDNDQDIFPLLNDENGHNPKNFYEDVCPLLLKDSRICRLFDHLSKHHFLNLFARPVLILVNCIFLLISGCILVLIQLIWQFLLNLIFFGNRVLKVFYNPYNFKFISSQSNPTINKNISQIKFVKEDYYYDLHILGTNNYYAEGYFHHNCGKSLMLILKAIDLALRYPNNFILMGRKTYVELRDTLVKEFFVICPEYLIKNYYKAEMKVKMINGSEIIFRHLDKMAETEIRSMNLGAVFIDQAEDISKDVFLALKGRLRRDGITTGERKIYMSINPELTWHFADFKQNCHPDYELVEASTLENQDNLPEEYIKDLLSYPENYKRQYVYGIWDESLLAGNIVFDREYLDKLSNFIKEPIEVKEGLRIYEHYLPGCRYQMGIDVAEGSEEETDKKDKSSITIINLTSLEEVAHWSTQVPPDVVAEKAVLFAGWYQEKGKNYCQVVPEMNAIGLALVNKLSQESNISIYRREEFDKSVGKRLKKLGWRTTRQSKPLLVNHFQELLRKANPKIRTKETLEELKTFIHTIQSKKSGMGAKEGFHDDRTMSMLLGFWEKGEVQPGRVFTNKENNSIIKVPIQPTLIVKDGRAQFRHLEPRLIIKNKWTTH